MARSYFSYSVIRSDPTNLTTGGDSIVTSLKDVNWEVKKIDESNNEISTSIYTGITGNTTIAGAAGVTDWNGLIEFWADTGQYVIKISDSKSRIANKNIYWDSVSGQVSGIPGSTIASETITTTQIKNLEVKTSDIEDLAVSAAKIAPSGVTTSKINDGAITSAKIGAGEVKEINITPSGVTTSKINDGAITSAKILDGTIVDTDIASANKDGSATTPSLRTLGTGANQATAGNDSRLSNARAPIAGSVSYGSLEQSLLDRVNGESVLTGWNTRTRIWSYTYATAGFSGANRSIQFFGHGLGDNVLFWIAWANNVKSIYTSTGQNEPVIVSRADEDLQGAGVIAVNMCLANGATTGSGTLLHVLYFFKT